MKVIILNVVVFLISFCHRKSETFLKEEDIVLLELDSGSLIYSRTVQSII